MEVPDIPQISWDCQTRDSISDANQISKAQTVTLWSRGFNKNTGNFVCFYDKHWLQKLKSTRDKGEAVAATGIVGRRDPSKEG